jgi:hypothetical protein
MARKAPRYRKVIAGLADLLFKLEYDTQLWMIKVHRDLLNALVRGSTHIQRAMTRSAGLFSEPLSPGALEPSVFKGNRNLTRYRGMKRRQRGMRTFSSGKGRC